jgi:hypothetical protein
MMMGATGEPAARDKREEPRCDQKSLDAHFAVQRYRPAASRARIA